MRLPTYFLHSEIMKDSRMRESNMIAAVAAHQFAMSLSPGSGFAESVGETGKRLNTKYQRYHVNFVYNRTLFGDPTNNVGVTR